MRYALTTLDDNADPTFNQLLGINNAGVISGYFGSGADAQHPNKGYTLGPLYGQGHYTNENVSGSAQTQVVGINDFGTTVGFAVDGAGNNTGFVDVNGTFTTVVDPNTVAITATGLTTDQLLGFNDLGQAVGFYADANGNSHGFLYNIAANSYSEITISGATSTMATGINNEGVISGIETVNGAQEGFIDNAGVITTLTGPADATSTSAFGLNDEGKVVGSYVGADGNTHGFVYDVASATYTTVDDPNSPTMTVINGINDQNQIVGFYQDANNTAVIHGFEGTLQGTVQTVTNPLAGEVIGVAQGSGGVAAGGSNNVTLQDLGVGGVSLTANAGNDTLESLATGDTLVGGAGNDVFFTGPGGNTAILGGGNNEFVGGGPDTIVATTGNDVVFGAAGTTAFGGSSGQMEFIATGGNTKVVNGGGQLLVFGSSQDGGAVYGGSGSTEYVGGAGHSDFFGGSGQSTVFAGSGGGLIEGGTGGGIFVGAAHANDQFVVGQGSSQVYAYDGNSVLLRGHANNVVVASGGNTTLVGAGSSGNNLFALGSGNVTASGGVGQDTFFVGGGNANITAGAGADVFAAVNGGSGGTDIIQGFKLGVDHFGLLGYGANEIQNDLAHASNVGGSTMLTLSDGTQIDFVGIGHLTASSFV